MTPIRFSSILNPNSLGYEFTNDSMTFWDQSYRYGNVLHCSMGYFETYGDKDVQHTPLMPCTKEHMTDFCISLCRHMLANPQIEIATYLFGFEKCRPETIKFLAGIVYKEDKRQWFSISDRKISTSESKQYDTRWTEVKRDCDGTIASAINLFWDQSKGAPRELFQRYADMDIFWDTLYNIAPHGNFEKLTEFKKTIPGDHHSAFRAVESLIKGLAAVEMAADCAQELFNQDRPNVRIRQRDFLTCTPADLGLFDFIAMNPPFTMRADVRHILHARQFLKPGGRLAALCFDTPARHAKLKPLCAEWQSIPAGTFKREGTNVPTAILLIENK